MQIHGLHQVSGIQSVNRPNTTKPAGPIESSPAVKSPSADQLDLSAEAQAISQSQAAESADASEIRAEKVGAIRQAIAEGTYETPEKLSVALDNLLDTFA